MTIQDVFEAVGKHASGKMTNAELKDLEDHACPGPGACGGQFTANTMAIAFEFLGMSPMGRNGVPAMDQRKDDVAFECGKMVMELLKRDLRPRQKSSRESHWKMPSQRWPRPADRRMPCCIFLPSPVKPASS